MHSYTTDTSDDAARVQLERMRSMAPDDRFALASRLSEEVMLMAKAALARQHTDWDQRQVALRFIELQYGKELADAVAAEAGQNLG